MADVEPVMGSAGGPRPLLGAPASAPAPAPASASGPPPTPAVGDTGGFADVFPTLFGLAYRVGFRLLGDRGDAEDVAQEALARALLRWPDLVDRPEGWVVRVAANLAIDRQRRRRRSTVSDEDPVSTTDPVSADRLDLLHALGRLPRRQREVVALRYLADWSEQDVAAELGCSVGTVKSSGARGLRALRRRLDQQREGDHDVPAPR